MAYIRCMHNDSIHQVFSVPFSYPVVFTRALFDADNLALREALCRLNDAEPHRLLAFIDEGVDQANPALKQAIQVYCDTHAGALDLVKPPDSVVGGEAIKNDYRLIMSIVDTILEYRLCRHSFVIAVGGGAMLDAVGFATSIVHRGLRMVRAPTTTLAQNDAGIGVKNGMNLHGGKNAIGSFHPPFAVLNDFDLLQTLSQPHWIGGVAEAFKVALIKDADFFQWLCVHASAFAQRQPEVHEEMIVRCADLHLTHIRAQGDPFEMGTARPLDFGHWAAHKLESMTAYAVPHGAAVAIGVAIDTHYAMAQGWLSSTDGEALLRGLQETGFDLWRDEMAWRLGDGRLALLQGLDDFREHLGGALCVTFPDGVGRKREASEIDEDVMEKAILSLRTGIISK